MNVIIADLDKEEHTNVAERTGSLKRKINYLPIPIKITVVRPKNIISCENIT